MNEGVKPAYINRRLQAQYDVETLSRSKTFSGVNKLNGVNLAAVG